MTIKWVFRGNVYSLDIGHKTPWFEQIYRVSILKEYYDEHLNVVYATILWSI